MGIILEKMHSDSQQITYFLQMDHSGKTKCTICKETERCAQQNEVI